MPAQTTVLQPAPILVPPVWPVMQDNHYYGRGLAGMALASSAYTEWAVHWSIGPVWLRFACRIPDRQSRRLPIRTIFRFPPP